MRGIVKRFVSIPFKIGRFLLALSRVILRLPWNIYNFFRYRFWKIFIFVLLLNGYLIKIGLGRISKIAYIPRSVVNFCARFLQPAYQVLIKLNKTEEKTIHRVHLIELALRNMTFKKTRSLITIGGMSLGVATIVFLVSIGYGVQELIVSRVAQLSELKQADVALQAGTNVRIDDESLTNIGNLPEVEHVLPLISVVGRVNYKNSVSDMAVYGVTSEYLRESAIQPVRGEIFDSDDISRIVPRSGGENVELHSTEGEVAGVSDVQAPFGSALREIEFVINPGSWLRVRGGPTVDDSIIGYTRRVEGKQSGIEYSGGEYENLDGEISHSWIHAPVLLWENVDCDVEDADCAEGSYRVLRHEHGRQVQRDGYFARINVSQIETIRGAGTVLGESTSAREVLAEDTSSPSAILSDEEFLELSGVASGAGAVSNTDVEKIDLGDSALRQAVVNRSMLQLLNISEDEAVGETFTASFVVTSNLVGDREERIESVPATYTIIGVTPDDDSPIFYVPFMDLRTLGITNYSQLKVVVDDENDLPAVRNQIEGLGFVTSSVADTVAQIDSLFGTARTLLMLLGMSALGVAALGMFNTLTVSLLERTREVGLMKAMGMKSSEVKELFLTESMIMGFFGGVLGIFIGYLSAKMLGIGISLIALGSGVGFVDIAYLPITFVVFVVFLSLFVGLVTGFYPSRRATRISALNALRYE